MTIVPIIPGTPDPFRWYSCQIADHLVQIVPDVLYSTLSIQRDRRNYSIALERCAPLSSPRTGLSENSLLLGTAALSSQKRTAALTPLSYGQDTRATSEKHASSSCFRGAVIHFLPVGMANSYLPIMV